MSLSEIADTLEKSTARLTITGQQVAAGLRSNQLDIFGVDRLRTDMHAALGALHELETIIKTYQGRS